MKRLMAIIAVLAATLALTATPAHATHFPANYCDTGNWQGWAWPPAGQYWGAGNVCGQPEHGEWKGRAWDNDYGGDCVTIWASATLTGGYGAVPGTTTCGYGMVITSPWRNTVAAKMLLVKHQMDGRWTHSFQFWRCDVHGTFCP